MKTRANGPIGIVLALLLASGVQAAMAASAAAQPHEAAKGQAPPTQREKVDRARLFPAEAVTRHVLALGEKRLAYTATAATQPYANAKGELTAHIFSVTYTLDEPEPGRPITFVFNGGPGAASAYLHLGA